MGHHVRVPEEFRPARAREEITEMIFTRVLDVRHDLEAFNARTVPVIVLVGVELYRELCKNPDLDIPGKAWSLTTPIATMFPTMRVAGAEVHPVDVPLVRNPYAWRLLISTGVDGDVAS